MSEALVVLNNNEALALGGLGLDSKLFKLKPSTLELVQKLTRQEGAIPGKIRDTGMNSHFEEMHLVMLFPPVEQRQLYLKGQFNKESKICFSLDNIKPHERAKEPKAMFCNGCAFGSWDKYRKTKNVDDLPPCRNYYHLVVADRQTQMPYYLNVKGKSIAPFERAMQNVARLIAMLESNVKMANKQIKASNEALLAGSKTATGDELLIAPLLPMPNIFDISFKIYVTQEPGAPNFMYGFKDFAAMKTEDKAEFGQIYLDFVNRKSQGAVVDQVTVEAEAEAEAAEVDAALVQPATAVVMPTIPTGPITGVVVGKDEPITI